MHNTNQPKRNNKGTRLLTVSTSENNEKNNVYKLNTVCSCNNYAHFVGSFKLTGPGRDSDLSLPNELDNSQRTNLKVALHKI
jgi:hypothetical protein